MVDDWEHTFREDSPQLFNRRILDLCHEVKLLSEPNEFADWRAIRFHSRLCFELAFLHVHSIGSKDHPQARQGTCITLFLCVAWNLGTHSIGESLQGYRRFSGRARPLLIAQSQR
jgi:hypothetical protein